MRTCGRRGARRERDLDGQRRGELARHEPLGQQHRRYNGVGDTANFSTVNITANRTVTIDGSQSATWGAGKTGPTVGVWLLGDTTVSNHRWTFSAINGGTLTLAVAGQFTGDGMLTKLGTATLDLQAANVGFTGAINVNAGTLRLGHDDALSGFGIVTVGSGGTLRLPYSRTLDASASSPVLLLTARCCTPKAPR